MYVNRISESMRLRVHLSMILEVDNKGAVDLVNTFRVGVGPGILNKAVLPKRN
jgi:hypothetical protein